MMMAGTLAALTILQALSRPKSCLWLWWKPAPLALQSVLLSYCENTQPTPPVQSPPAAQTSTVLAANTWIAAWPGHSVR